MNFRDLVDEVRGYEQREAEYVTRMEGVAKRLVEAANAEAKTIGGSVDMELIRHSDPPLAANVLTVQVRAVLPLMDPAFHRRRTHITVPVQVRRLAGQLEVCFPSVTDPMFKSVHDVTDALPRLWTALAAKVERHVVD